VLEVGEGLLGPAELRPRKVNPRKTQSSVLATRLFCSLTVSLSFEVKYLVMLARTRSPARTLRTTIRISSA
jgi:hypothetical protein